MWKERKRKKERRKKKNNAKFSGHYVRPRSHAQRSCASTMLGPISNPLWNIYDQQTLQLYHILELRRCVHDQREYTVELELIKIRCNFQNTLSYNWLTPFMWRPCLS